jgi:hypothetical protein
MTIVYVFGTNIKYHFFNHVTIWLINYKTGDNLYKQFTFGRFWFNDGEIIKFKIKNNNNNNIYCLNETELWSFESTEST